MSKTKKSKLLASMLCATVVAGLYASPVMAATGLTLGGGDVVAASEVTINGVTLAGNKVTARYGDFTNSITVGGNTLTGATVSKVNNLFDKNATTKSIIYAGNGSQIGGVTFNNGAVTGVTSLTATGTITGNAITANGKLTAKGGSSITYTNGTTTATSTVGSTIINKVVNGDNSSTATISSTSVGNNVKGKDKNDNSYTANSTTAYNSISDKLTVKNADGDSVSTVSRTMTSAGLVDSFAGSDGTTHTVTTNAKGTTFGGTGATGTTVINGGSITTGSLTVGGMEIKAGATSGTVEIGGITLKKDTATGGLAVDALDIENVTLNKNGFKLDATNAANGFAVEGASGALKVKDIPGSAGSSTMVYTTAKDGTNTMWLDTATGNLSTVGTVSIGGELGGTAKVVIDGETGSIKVGNELFAVDGTNGNAKLEGELIVNNGLVAGTDGSGTFKVKNIDGNTMAYMVDKDGNYTVGINAQNGNIETKGALAVTNAEGNNVFTANSNGMSVGNGNFAVNAATGDTKIAGGLDVGTDIKVAGSITASSLTLDGVNVGDAITDLQDAVGDITGSGLPGKVEGIKRTGSDVSGYTTTIEGVVSVSEAKNGRPGTFSIVNGVDPFNDDVFSVNDHGFINATAIDYKGDVKAEFNLDDTEAKLVYGENGIAANANGTTITGAGTDLTLDANGATFTNVNGTTTIINGSSITTGAITADSISVGKIGDVETAINDLKDYVGDTGTGSETLAERVQGLETNTQNIIYQDSVTHIKGAVSFQNGYQVTFKHDGKDVSLGSLVDRIDDIDSRLDVVEDKTQNINSDATHGGNGETGEGGAVVDNGANTGFDGDLTVGGDVTANNGNFVGDVQVGGSLNVGGENGTSITGEGMTVGSTNVSDGKITVGEGVVQGEDGKYTGSQVTVGDGDVKVEWTEDGEKQSASIQENAQKIEDLGNTVTSEVNRLDNRISKVEDRIDKVGAMSAAIANLRTMGYDPTAPTEIAVGIGQYRSETGAALGLFHYPNKDFMLSLSVSTSGDEVMGGIGATWKFGRKTPEQMLAAEKEKAAKAKLAKAEAMKKAAAEAKVAEQQAKHAKMAAEKAAK